MLSTLSNSSPHFRAPKKSWRVLAAVTLVTVIGGFVGLETTWRAFGHEPSVVDSPQLWSYHRSQIDERHPETLVLLGASRAQLSVATDTVRERLPDWHVAQLAIDGRGPVALLRHFAVDTEYRGVIIMSASGPILESRTFDAQQEYVDAYAAMRWRDYADAIRSAFLQKTFASLNPRVALDDVVRDLLSKRSAPRPAYLVTRFDRSRRAEYSTRDMERQRAIRAERTRRQFAERVPPAPEVWFEGNRVVEEYIRTIQERGGKVVLVEFPMTGPVLDLFESTYPRDEYWNRFAAESEATMINFLDEPTLRDFDCPDYSHLDYRDAPAFTNALLDILSERGIL